MPERQRVRITLEADGTDPHAGRKLQGIVKGLCRWRGWRYVDLEWFTVEERGTRNAERGMRSETGGGA